MQRDDGKHARVLSTFAAEQARQDETDAAAVGTTDRQTPGSKLAG